MSAHRDGTPLVSRVLLVGGATIAMALTIIAVHRVTSVRASNRVPDVPLITAGPAIVAEADAYRLRAAPDPVAEDRRRPGAHPRTLATYHALRSYPGAPPRVPHGLTAMEFRTSRCTPCHERGGYSQRFGTYAPVTPHPELRACLSCHAATSGLAGFAVLPTGPNDTCRQCHVGTPALFHETGVDWRPAAWPVSATRAAGSVPPIPHDLAMRGNCLACHSGPGAVAELRTSHPERADCRQCHVVTDGGGAAYERRRVATSRGPSVP